MERKYSIHKLNWLSPQYVIQIFVKRISPSKDICKYVLATSAKEYHAKTINMIYTMVMSYPPKNKRLFTNLISQVILLYISTD